ncbi:MAG: response regulator [Planctomycetota bacterium]|nr:response regulator [Planctomycetota bacterium]
MITAPSQVVATVRLSDQCLAQLLDRLDAEERSSTSANQTFPYRHKSIVAAFKQPGSITACMVCSRNLGARHMSFIHGGYLHVGTTCQMQLLTLRGARENLSGKVVACRYLERQLHEVHIRFDCDVCLSRFCDEAAQRRVLLAASEPSVVRLAVHFLGQLNAEVEHAANGELAIEMALKEQFDLILMDLNLPLFDGFEAVAILRSKGYTGSIVAAGTLTDPVDRQRCLAAGFDQYLAMPLTSEDLGELLESLSEGPLFSSLRNDASMKQLVNAFVSELPQMVANLEQSAANENFGTLTKLSAIIKQGGLAYGFDAISNAAIELETALIDGATIDDAERLLKALIKVCNRAKGCAP